MNCEKEISNRIEKIKAIFQTAKDLSTDEKDQDSLITQLNNTESEFRSIAYEGASMGIALTDLAKGDSLNDWRSFAEKANAHAAQIHAGLGWAIAQQNLSALSFPENVSPLLRSRIIDGCGYYDGIFRQRTSIKAQKTPEELKGEMLLAYDQGIGRSLWYICKGDLHKLKEMVLSFPSDRHRALWLGIGVACSYVGGCDEELLKSLLLASDPHQTQLAVGATLAARARVQSNTMTDDVELACRIFCNQSTQKAAMLSVNTEPDSSVNPNESYALWLLQIEKELLFSHDHL